MEVPSHIETALHRLEWELKVWGNLSSSFRDPDWGPERMKAARQIEGAIGRFLGVTGAPPDVVEEELARLSACTDVLLRLGVELHPDHFEQDDELSYLDHQTLRGAVERVQRHRFAARTKTLEWKDLAGVDPTLSGLASWTGGARLGVLAASELMAARVGAHPRQRILTIEAVEALTFLQSLAAALDAQVVAPVTASPVKTAPPAPAKAHGGAAKAFSATSFAEWCAGVLEEIERTAAAARDAITPRASDDSALAYGRGDDISHAKSPGRRLDAIRADVVAAHRRLMDEPFILRAEVADLDTGEATPHVYCVARDGVAGVQPAGLRLVSARTHLGLALRSLDEGEEDVIEVAGAVKLLRLVRRVEVRPNGAAHAPRDAAVTYDGELQTASARDWVGRVRDGASLAVEATSAAAKRGARSQRRRAFELFDQRALYRAQREALQAPLGGPLVLQGPAGTGKTTAVVKRIVDLLALALEPDAGLDERRAELGVDDAMKAGCPMQEWVLVAPHADWVRYARRAFEQEGRVAVDPRRVRTWANLRGELLRRAFGAEATTEVARSAGGGRWLEEATRAAVAAADAALRAAVVAAGSHTAVDVRRDAPLGELIRVSPRIEEALSALRREERRARGEATAAEETAAEETAAEETAGGEATTTAAEATGEAAGGATDGSGDARPTADKVLKALRRAWSTWLDGARAARDVASGEGWTAELTQELGLLLLLRNGRALAVESLRGARGEVPKAALRALGLMLGHVHVDEFENRSVLELAILAALVHPSGGGTFSGDPEQATEAATAGVGGRLALALELARAGAANLIRFERRVRQTTRLAAASEALRSDKGSLPPIRPEDPEILVEEALPRAEWAGWAAERFAEIVARVGPVTLAAIASRRGDGDWLARALAEELDELDVELPVVRLDDKQRPSSSDAAIYVASLEDPQLLHGLEFEGVLLLGVDAMVEHHAQAMSRIYVALTRAATYLGVTAERRVPDALGHLVELAGGSDWE